MIKVKVKPDPYYRREGSDVHTDRFISMTQAILGGRVDIKTLYGNVALTI